MLTFVNELDITNIGLQGLRIYGRLRDAPGSKWVDFGNIENLAANREETENNIQSARNGTRTTVKTLTSELTDTFTFESLDITDKAIVAIHEGADTYPMVNDAGNFIVIRTPGAKREMELAILEPGAPNTDSRLQYIPRVQVKGNGGTPSNGTDPARIAFSVTVLTDEAYVVPATVLANTPAAPTGVVVGAEASATPVADLEAVLELLAASLDAEGGV
jgi:hypothetical protein